MGHYLAKSIAKWLYGFLGGGEILYLSEGQFAKKKRRTICKDVARVKKEKPHLTWDEIVGAVTEDLLENRTRWDLHLKQEGLNRRNQSHTELHVICMSNQEGADKSSEVLGWMMDAARQIVNEARSEAIENPNPNGE